MNHIVLLGDSIFDNAAYVAGGPDVVRQLRDILPSGWRATLNALDGAVIADLPQQLRSFPAIPAISSSASAATMPSVNPVCLSAR